MDNRSSKKARKNKGSRPTARDVAGLAGVSQSTVSRILSGDTSEFFSEKTRKRVLKVAAELGYSPNPIARALRGKHTHLIGLIIRNISDPFFAELVSEISIQARELGYQMVLGHAQSEPDQVLRMSHVLDTRHTDGVIILGDLEDDKRAIQDILDGNRALVTMCRGQAQPGILTVNVDNHAGMQDLLEHVRDLGHSRLAFIQGGGMGDFQVRRKEFIQFLDDNEFDFDPAWLINETDDCSGGYCAMQQLLGQPHRPTAVIAADDLIAMGALAAALEAGVRVPEEISITGFDGIEMTRYMTPALTTVRQPIDAMSRIALARLLDLIGGGSVGDQNLILVRPELVVRHSTGPVPMMTHSPGGGFADQAIQADQQV
ncbi:MAG TPA: LacI family DNA-binding transcriptional regulator [Anaerolineales bacterium]|nr:LacI family DNA-binding transcriptional regulator [Anaerolineales bacterium]